MNTQEVANRLVELCRTGQFEQAQKELYAENVVSIEPDGTPMPRVEGIQALIEKGKAFAEMNEEVHGMTVSEPLVADNFITCTMNMDVTMKGGQRVQMDEVCLYEVKDGKIVREEFFYTPAPQN